MDVMTTRLIRDLKDSLASLALMTLGQHQWDLRIRLGINATVCFCSLCDKARKAYREATGLIPTLQQEDEAMANWAKGVKD